MITPKYLAALYSSLGRSKKNRAYPTNQLIITFLMSYCHELIIILLKYYNNRKTKNSPQNVRRKSGTTKRYTELGARTPGH